LKGFLIVYKNFDINSLNYNDYEIIPAHNKDIIRIIYSHSDNKLYTLGEDGIIIIYDMNDFDDIYNNNNFEKEYLVGTEFLNEINKNQIELQRKIEFDSKQTEIRCKLNLDTNRAQIEELIKEKEHLVLNLEEKIKQTYLDYNNKVSDKKIEKLKLIESLNADYQKL